MFYAFFIISLCVLCELRWMNEWMNEWINKLAITVKFYYLQIQRPRGDAVSPRGC